MTQLIEANAAVIDVGSTEMSVAGPVDHDLQPGAVFQHSHNDLVALANWLKQCVVSVTGVGNWVG